MILARRLISPEWNGLPVLRKCRPEAPRYLRLVGELFVITPTFPH
jgi:hypothetical protein